MANYRLQDRALADLSYIYETGILTFGLQQADRYYDGLIAQFEELASNPFLYRERMEMRPPVRVCPYGVHVILYTLKDEDVLILRVRHAREDWR